MIKMDQKWLKTLSACPLFKGINHENLDLMLGCLKPRIAVFKKNDFLALAGEPFEGLGVVLSGTVAVTKESPSGSRMILTILGPGEMFGEMAAFSQKRQWPATVVAQKNCTVFFLPPEKIVGQCEKQCSGHKILILNMLRIISDKALMLNRRLEYLSIKNMRAKISCFLLEQYKNAGKEMYVLPLSRNELADFLNVARPSLSRELSRMRDEGVIDFYRSSIQIKDLEALKKMVE